MNQNSLKVSFSRPLVSPRTLTKNIEGGKIDK